MKKIAIAWTVFLLLVATAMAASYGYATRQDQVFTPEMRATLSGQYVTLPQGVMRYDWAGPVNGPVVVLVHGFSTPSFVFYRNVGALAQAGYRVLTFDHLGRGYSDRPDGPYGADFYDRELLDLLAALNITAPVRLLGYSMGGGVAATFASRHPEKVAKLILVAPIGYLTPEDIATQLLRLPLLGEWLMAVAARQSFIGAFQKEVDQGLFTPQIGLLYAQQFDDPGYRHALLSTMREFLFEDMDARYRAWGAKGRPTLVLWGSADTTVPISGLPQLKDAVPHAKVLVLDGVGHSLVYVNFEAVNRDLLEFLR